MKNKRQVVVTCLLAFASLALFAGLTNPFSGTTNRISDLPISDASIAELNGLSPSSILSFSGRRYYRQFIQIEFSVEEPSLIEWLKNHSEWLGGAYSVREPVSPSSSNAWPDYMFEEKDAEWTLYLRGELPQETMRITVDVSKETIKIEIF